MVQPESIGQGSRAHPSPSLAPRASPISYFSCASRPPPAPWPHHRTSGSSAPLLPSTHGATRGCPPHTPYPPQKPITPSASLIPPAENPRRPTPPPPPPLPVPIRILVRLPPPPNRNATAPPPPPSLHPPASPSPPLPPPDLPSPLSAASLPTKTIIFSYFPSLPGRHASPLSPPTLSHHPPPPPYPLPS